MNIGNPYHYQDEVRDSTYFVGREEPLENIEYLLSLSLADRPQYHNIAVTGESGAGKTSLTYAVEDFASDLDIPTVRLDLNKQSATNEVSIFKDIYQKIADKAGSSIQDSLYELMRGVTDSVEIDLKFVRFHLSPTDGQSRSEDGSTPEVSETIVKSDLKEIFRRSNHPAFLVVLDNAHHLSEEGLILEKLKNIFTGIDGYCLLLSGKQEMLSEPGDAHRRISRVIDKFEIGPFESIEQTEECLRRPLPEEKQQILDQQTVHKIHDLTNGRPYEINLLGFYMYYHYTEEGNDSLRLTSGVIADAAAQIESSSISVQKQKIKKIKDLNSNGIQSLIPLIEHPELPLTWLVNYALLLSYDTTSMVDIENTKERIEQTVQEQIDSGLITKNENGNLYLDADVYTTAFLKYQSVSKDVISNFGGTSTFSTKNVNVNQNMVISNVHYRLVDSILLSTLENCHSHYSFDEVPAPIASFREVLIDSEEGRDHTEQNNLLSDRQTSVTMREELLREVNLQRGDEENNHSNNQSSNTNLHLRCNIEWLDVGYSIQIYAESEEVIEAVLDRLRSLEVELEAFGYQFSQETVNSHLEQSYDYLDDEEYELAIAELDEAKKINPNHQLIPFTKTFAYHSMEEYEDALTSINEAINGIDGWTDALYFKAIILLDMGEYEKSADAFRKVTDLAPKDYSVREEIYCSFDFEKPRFAIKNGLVASDIRPDETHPYFHLARAYTETEDYEEVIEPAEKVIKRSDNPSQVATSRVMKGVAHMHIDEDEEAVSEFSTCIDNQVTEYSTLRSHLQRGIIRISEGQLEEAERDLTEVIERTVAVEEDDAEIATDKQSDSEFDWVRAKAFFERGRTRLELGCDEKANSDLQKAGEIDSEYFDIIQDLEMNADQSGPSGVRDLTSS